MGVVVVSEALGERVVVDLELSDLFVLVGGDGDEGGLREVEGVEGVPTHGKDVVGLHHVDARLVLVHGVEDDLGGGGVVGWLRMIWEEGWLGG